MASAVEAGCTLALVGEDMIFVRRFGFIFSMIDTLPVSTGPSLAPRVISSIFPYEFKIPQGKK